MTPFDFLKSINETKENLIVDELSEKDYTPYVINKGLSYFPDTILYSNEMNRLHLLDPKVQFQYLLNSIRPRKRYSKWHKTELTEDLKAISEYFGYSHAKAKQVQSLISSEQLLVMKEKLQKGGLNTKEKKNGD
jgi:hypothetical protein